MAHFLDLPLELLPIVFGFVLNPEHIFSLCLVSKSFNQFATPLLYRRVSIFAWYKDAKNKVVVLFQTLSRCPHLARHVEKLGESAELSHDFHLNGTLAEIRDFPKALLNKSHSDLLQICAQGVGNCINLRSCVWTRDGSLHSAILESLCGCPLLHELEINGNDSGYSPNLLTQFSRLSKISLIMPNAPVLDILPTWVSITGDTLRSLTILCKTSVLVTDTFLSQLASDLQGLEYLSIIGCPRVTHVGIGAIASANKSGLIEINIEAVSQTFDMFAFKVTCFRTLAFRRLRAITLTVHANVALADWSRDVGDLLSSVPLEAFSMYSISTSAWAPVPSEFWQGIVEKHGQRLKKLSVHRIRIGLAALEMICSQCPLLEQLFIAVEQHELDDAACLFALAKNLRVLHINFPMIAVELLTVSPLLLMQKAVSIVSVCSPTLFHIGCNMRVWQVKRVVHLNENGEKYVTPTLAPQENPVIPEQFLVVRA